LTHEQTRVVFLDRDGVLNTRFPEYISSWNQYVWYPWTFESLRLLHKAGARVFVFTNQSAVGRGYFPEHKLTGIHTRLRERLSEAGIELTGIYYCPHTPEDRCDCRKPKPGMLLQAASEYNIDLSEAWVIGDYMDDIRAGKAVKAHTILLKCGRRDNRITGDDIPEVVSENLLDGAKHIVQYWENTV